ncbi:hypothetical protein [Bradyrhizobium sp. ISRA464]|uniref:hypothetical protein n=1 Tax=Bradyrhizobium sp. ISRA464 TaxID=2866200 RepID=UPI0024789F72|nr:hypothetical protein [Bradyrhizobium sp. ISRA464]WGS25640.1 hypothetical protein MTX19_28025 [Bradyrhizobium sp. ISRA464]
MRPNLERMIEILGIMTLLGGGRAAELWEGRANLLQNSFFSSSRASSDPIDLPMEATIFPRETFLAPRTRAEAA